MSKDIKKDVTINMSVNVQGGSDLQGLLDKTHQLNVQPNIDGKKIGKELQDELDKEHSITLIPKIDREKWQKLIDIPVSLHHVTIDSKELREAISKAAGDSIKVTIETGSFDFSDIGNKFQNAVSDASKKGLFDISKLVTFDSDSILTSLNDAINHIDVNKINKLPVQVQLVGVDDAIKNANGGKIQIGVETVPKTTTSSSESVSVSPTKSTTSNGSAPVQPKSTNNLTGRHDYKLNKFVFPSNARNTEYLLAKHKRYSTAIQTGDVEYINKTYDSLVEALLAGNILNKNDYIKDKSQFEIDNAYTGETPDIIKQLRTLVRKKYAKNGYYKGFNEDLENQINQLRDSIVSGSVPRSHDALVILLDKLKKAVKNNGKRVFSDSSLKFVDKFYKDIVSQYRSQFVSNEPTVTPIKPIVNPKPVFKSTKPTIDPNEGKKEWKFGLTNAQHNDIRSKYYKLAQLLDLEEEERIGQPLLNRKGEQIYRNRRYAYDVNGKPVIDEKGHHKTLIDGSPLVYTKKMSVAGKIRGMLNNIEDIEVNKYKSAEEYQQHLAEAFYTHLYEGQTINGVPFEELVGKGVPENEKKRHLPKIRNGVIDFDYPASGTESYIGYYIKEWQLNQDEEARSLAYDYLSKRENEFETHGKYYKEWKKREPLYYDALEGHYTEGESEDITNRLWNIWSSFKNADQPEIKNILLGQLKTLLNDAKKFKELKDIVSDYETKLEDVLGEKKQKKIVLGVGQTYDNLPSTTSQDNVYTPDETQFILDEIKKKYNIPEKTPREKLIYPGQEVKIDIPREELFEFMDKYYDQLSHGGNWTKQQSEEIQAQFKHILNAVDEEYKLKEEYEEYRTKLEEAKQYNPSARSSSQSGGYTEVLSDLDDDIQENINESYVEALSNLDDNIQPYTETLSDISPTNILEEKYKEELSDITEEQNAIGEKYKEELSSVDLGQDVIEGEHKEVLSDLNTESNASTNEEEYKETLSTPVKQTSDISKDLLNKWYLEGFSVDDFLDSIKGKIDDKIISQIRDISEDDVIEYLDNHLSDQVGKVLKDIIDKYFVGSETITSSQPPAVESKPTPKAKESDVTSPTKSDREYAKEIYDRLVKATGWGNDKYQDMELNLFEFISSKDNFYSRGRDKLNEYERIVSQIEKERSEKSNTNKEPTKTIESKSQELSPHQKLANELLDRFNNVLPPKGNYLRQNIFDQAIPKLRELSSKSELTERDKDILNNYKNYIEHFEQKAKKSSPTEISPLKLRETILDLIRRYLSVPNGNGNITADLSDIERALVYRSPTAKEIEKVNEFKKLVESLESNKQNNILQAPVNNTPVNNTEPKEEDLSGIPYETAKVSEWAMADIPENIQNQLDELYAEVGRYHYLLIGKLKKKLGTESLLKPFIETLIPKLQEHAQKKNGTLPNPEPVKVSAPVENTPVNSTQESKPQVPVENTQNNNSKSQESSKPLSTGYTNEYVDDLFGRYFKAYGSGQDALFNLAYVRDVQEFEKIVEKLEKERKAHQDFAKDVYNRLFKILSSDKEASKRFSPLLDNVMYYITKSNDKRLSERDKEKLNEIEETVAYAENILSKRGKLDIKEPTKTAESKPQTSVENTQDNNTESKPQTSTKSDKEYAKEIHDRLHKARGYYGERHEDIEKDLYAFINFNGYQGYGTNYKTTINSRDKLNEYDRIVTEFEKELAAIPIKQIKDTFQELLNRVNILKNETSDYDAYKDSNPDYHFEAADIHLLSADIIRGLSKQIEKLNQGYVTSENVELADKYKNRIGKLEEDYQNLIKSKLQESVKDTQDNNTESKPQAPTEPVNENVSKHKEELPIEKSQVAVLHALSNKFFEVFGKNLSGALQQTYNNIYAIESKENKTEDDEQYLKKITSILEKASSSDNPALVSRMQFGKLNKENNINPDKILESAIKEHIVPQLENTKVLPQVQAPPTIQQPVATPQKPVVSQAPTPEDYSFENEYSNSLFATTTQHPVSKPQPQPTPTQKPVVQQPQPATPAPPQPKVTLSSLATVKDNGEDEPPETIDEHIQSLLNGGASDAITLVIKKLIDKNVKAEIQKRAKKIAESYAKTIIDSLGLPKESYTSIIDNLYQEVYTKEANAELRKQIREQVRNDLGITKEQTPDEQLDSAVSKLLKSQSNKQRLNEAKKLIGAYSDKDRLKEIQSKKASDLTDEDKQFLFEQEKQKQEWARLKKENRDAILNKENPKPAKITEASQITPEIHDKLLQEAINKIELKDAIKKIREEAEETVHGKSKENKPLVHQQAIISDGLRQNSIYDDLTGANATKLNQASKYFALKEAIEQLKGTPNFDILSERFNMMGGVWNTTIGTKIATELNNSVPPIQKLLDFSTQRMKLEDVKDRYGEDSKKYQIMEKLYNEMVRLNQKGADYRKFETLYDKMFGKNMPTFDWKEVGAKMLSKGLNALPQKAVQFVQQVGNRILSTINKVIMKTVKMAINPFKKSVHMFSNAIKRAGGKSKILGSLSDLLLMPIVLAVEYTLLPVLKKLIPSIRNTTEWVIQSKDKFEQLGKVLGIIASRFYDVVTSNFILSFNQLFKTLEDNSDWIDEEYGKDDTFFDKVKNAGVDLHNISDDFSALSDVVKETNDELVSLAEGKEMGEILHGFVMTVEQALTNSLDTTFRSLLSLSKNDAFDLKGIIAQGLQDGLTLVATTTELGTNIIESLNKALTEIFTKDENRDLLNRIRTNISNIVKTILESVRLILPEIVPILKDIFLGTFDVWKWILLAKLGGDLVGSGIDYGVHTGLDWVGGKIRNKWGKNRGSGGIPNTTGGTVPVQTGNKLPDGTKQTKLPGEITGETAKTSSKGFLKGLTKLVKGIPIIGALAMVGAEADAFDYDFSEHNALENAWNIASGNAPLVGVGSADTEILGVVQDSLWSASKNSKGVNTVLSEDYVSEHPELLQGLPTIELISDDISDMKSLLADYDPLRQPQNNEKAMNLEQTFNINIDPTNNSVTVDKQEKGFGDSLINLLNRFNINGAV